MIHAQALYFDVIRDCYEAFVIYWSIFTLLLVHLRKNSNSPLHHISFLTVMLMYTGGDAACLSEVLLLITT